MYTLTNYVTCTGIEINAFFPDLVHLVVNILKIGTPIVLIVLGMMDMFKAMTAQKEDEIKKAQGLFFKRLVSAILVFLVFVIVDLLFGVLGSFDGMENDDAWDCAVCFIRGSEDSHCSTHKKAG